MFRPEHIRRVLCARNSIQLTKEGFVLLKKHLPEVKTGHFYTTDGENVFVAVADGMPTSENDTNYLEPL